jgi:tripartite-type tricarboxylate transporter receptor subunit TctC
MIIGDMITAMPFVNAGRVRLLAACTAKRIPQLPNLPTLIESGVPLDATAWIGVFAPAHTPAAIVEKIGAELRGILKLPDVQEKLASDGTDFGANTPQSLVKFIAAESEKYRTAVKVSGRRLE